MPEPLDGRCQSETTLPEGFKETELGPLPENWEVVRLGEVTSYTKRPRGFRLPTDAILFIPMELIPNNGVSIENYITKAPAEIRSGIYCEKGDILIPRITPCFENGKQGLLNNIPQKFAFATTEVFPLKTKADKLERLFIFYFLLIPNVRRDIAAKMEGTTGRQRIPKTVIENLPIPLPPLPEQEKIARILSAVQRSMEAQDKIISATRELKKSLMRHLFTYGPVPVDQVDKVALEKTEIGPMPEHWEVVTLGEVGKIITGTTPRTEVPEYYDGPYMFISPGDIGESRYVIKTQKYLSEEGLRVSRSLPCDTVLVVCIGATIGKTAMTATEKSTTNQQINAVIANGNVTPSYLYYAAAYRSPYLPSLAGRAAVPIVNKSNFAKFSIPLPPLPEQQKIAQILSAVDAKIEKEEKKKTALEGLFKSLLNNLMTGKIRVNNLKL